MLQLNGKYDSDTINKTWKTVLLNQFHDVIPGSSIHEVYDDVFQMYEEAQTDITKVSLIIAGSGMLIEILPLKDFDKLQGINVFRRELSVTVSREQSDVFVKNTKKYYNLEFFALSVPLYLNRQKGEISSSSNSFLTIKDTALPIGYTVFEEQYLSSTKRTLNDNELKALSKKRLSKKELQELDGFSIVNKTEKYDINENSCTATFTYVIRRK